MWQEKYFILLLSNIPIKYLLEDTKVIRSLIDPSIKEGNCFDAWKFVARPFKNGSSQIQGIDFDQSYSPVAHVNSFKTKISIAAMHRLLSDRILGVSNAF